MTQRRFLPLILALFAPLSAACGDPAEPQLVDRISLEPDSVFVSPGEIATFSAMPISERGDRLEDRASRVQWTITSPNLSGESAEGSTFSATAESVGTGFIFATLGDASQEAKVFVQPPGLAQVEIVTAGAIVDGAHTIRPEGFGDNQRVFEGRLFDAAGIEMAPAGFRISWSSSNEGVLQPLGETGYPLIFLAGGDGWSDLTLVVGKIRRTVRVTVARSN